MSDTLMPLLAKLRNCPSHDVSVSREMFVECWEELCCDEDIRHHTKPTIPVMAALILSDARFKQLLNEHENAQLIGLITVAIDRYDQRTNPPNKLGKIIAGSIKKEI